MTVPVETRPGVSFFFFLLLRKSVDFQNKSMLAWLVVLYFSLFSLTVSRQEQEVGCPYKEASYQHLLVFSDSLRASLKWRGLGFYFVSSFFFYLWSLTKLVALTFVNLLQCSLVHLTLFFLLLICLFYKHTFLFVLYKQKYLNWLKKKCKSGR